MLELKQDSSVENLNKNRLNNYTKIRDLEMQIRRNKKK